MTTWICEVCGGTDPCVYDTGASHLEPRQFSGCEKSNWRKVDPADEPVEDIGFSGPIPIPFGKDDLPPVVFEVVKCSNCANRDLEVAVCSGWPGLSNDQARAEFARKEYIKLLAECDRKDAEIKRLEKEAEFHREVVIIKDETIKAERAKNAGVVDALEGMKETLDKLAAGK